MLLRNIIWMFWPETEWWPPFVEGGDLPDVYRRSQQSPTVFVGHIDYSPVALWHTRLCKKLIIVRHPEQYTLSFARFLLSEEFRAISAIAQLVASHQLSLREVVRLVLLGTHYQGETIPGIRDQFTHKALAWIDADARLTAMRSCCRLPRHLGQCGASAISRRCLRSWVWIFRLIGLRG